MVIDFAKINVKEQPVLILQNLDDTPIGVLKYAFNVEADLCYNEISTLTFDLPAYVDRKLTENYGRVVGMRIIDLMNYGRFLLVDPKVDDDGIKQIKSCTAYSLEYEFSFKKLPLTEGTYNLWNPIAPKGTILGMILELMPSWSVGSVDATLIDKYRTFDDSGDQNIYNFMKSDLENYTKMGRLALRRVLVQMACLKQLQMVGSRLMMLLRLLAVKIPYQLSVQQS